MMDTTVLVGIVSVILLLIYWASEKRKRRSPSGPWGLPIVGYIPFLTSKPYIQLQNLAKIYGPIFSVRLGSQNVLVLSDLQSIREAFSQDAFIGRPPEMNFGLSKETLETGAMAGLNWKNQRRFSLHILRDLGFGKSRLEGMVKEEIMDLLNHYEQSDGRPMFVRPLLAPSMSNNISSLMFGQRRKYDDPVRIMLDRTFSEFGPLAGMTALRIFFPWLTKLFKFLGLTTADDKLKLVLKDMREYILQEIEDHEKTVNENNIRDYIDGYLLEIRKSNDTAFCKGVLLDLVGGFFGAGSETVRITVEWLMLTMAAYPDVQKKVCNEIDQVLGQNRGPEWSDHIDMPFTQATIYELIRWKSIIPINILRYTIWDTTLNDYFVPKNTCVMANLWAVHHDPANWGEDAEEFRPQRFLSEDGKSVIKPDYFIPFSIGKRSCPGESFAKTEVFLYFVSIFQKFQVSFPKGSDVPNFDGELGIGLSPKQHELSITKRINETENKTDVKFYLD